MNRTNFRSLMLLSTSVVAASIGYARRAYADTVCTLTDGTYVCSGSTEDTQSIAADNASVVLSQDFRAYGYNRSGVRVTGDGQLTVDMQEGSYSFGYTNGLYVRSNGALVDGDGYSGGATITINGTATSDTYGLRAIAISDVDVDPLTITVGSSGNVRGYIGMFVSTDGVDQDITIDYGGVASGNYGAIWSEVSNADLSLTVDGRLGGSFMGARITGNNAGQITVDIGETGSISSGGTYFTALYLKNGGTTNSITIDGDVAATGANGVGIIGNDLSGDTTITIGESGSITGSSGILFSGSSTMSSLTITVDGELAATSGPAVTFLGSASATTIDATIGADGAVTSTGGAGLILKGGDITVTVDGSIETYSDGLYARSDTTSGAGFITIDVDGTITASNSGSYGIKAAASGAVPVAITVGEDGSVSGGTAGIMATQSAADGVAGATDIKVYGSVSGTYGVVLSTETGGAVSLLVGAAGSIEGDSYGALLESNRDEALDITVEDGGSISGDVGLGIRNGGDDTTITIDGEVTGTTTAILAQDLSGSTELTVGATGVVYGKDQAIEFRESYGSASIGVTVDGEVWSHSGTAISTSVAGVTSATVTVNSGGSVHSDDGQAISLTGADVSVVIGGAVSTSSTDNVAITLFGVNSATLELLRGYSIIGDVVASASGTNTLVFGGSETGADADSFDVSLLDDGVGETEQFQGFDALEKIDGGEWTLTGTTAATGSLTASAGLLTVDAVMSGFALSVEHGASLEGTGTLGSLSVADGGSVTAGGSDSVGTLTVDGDVTFESGSNLTVGVAALESSLLDVDGTVTIADGATLTLNRLDATTAYPIGTVYTLVAADDGVSGTFSTVDDSAFAFLEATLSYEADAVLLTLERNEVTFPSVGETQNQQSVAAAIENLGSANALYDEIAVLSSTEAVEAFETLSGNTIADLPRLLLSQTSDLSALVGARVSGRDRGVAPSGALPMGYAESSTAEAAEAAGQVAAAGAADASQGAVWIQGHSGTGAVDSDGNGTGFDYTSGGLTAGTDGWVTPNLLVGAAYDYVGVSASFDDDAGSADISRSLAAVYAHYRADALSLDAKVGYGISDVSTTRNIVVGSAVAEAKGNYSGTLLTAGLGAGYDVDLGGGTVLRPKATLDYQRLADEGYTETGAGIYNLTIDSRMTESLQSGLGVTLESALALDGRPDAIVLSAEVKWQHEFLDTSSEMSAAFADYAGSGFYVSGNSAATDSAVLGVGADFAIGDASWFYARYRGQFDASQVSNLIVAGWRGDW